MKEDFIIVGYFSKDTMYEHHAQVFKRSLLKQKVLFYLHPIESLGSWYANTCHKPTFLLQMLESFKGLNVVYVDVDAELLRYPQLFHTIEGDVAVHNHDRQRTYRRTFNDNRHEVLSGTIFLRNNERVKEIVKRWEARCKRFPEVWDQKSLEVALRGEFTNLPIEYCKIFDRMTWVTEPVIVHYQASRVLRRSGHRKDAVLKMK